MAITISGENNNDRILASDGVLDSISGINAVGVVTATSFTGDLIGDVTGNLTGNVTGNINNSTLLLQTGGTERLRITSAGDVGIGVNDPDAKLEVLEDIFVKGSSGDGDTGIQIRSGSSALSNQHQIRTGGGNGNMLFLEAVGATGIIAMKTNGAEALRINSDGTLEINQSGTNTNVLANDQGGPNIWLKNTSNTDGNYSKIGFFNSTGYITAFMAAQYQDAGDRNTDLVFGTRVNGGNLLERLRIHSHGQLELKVPDANDALKITPSGTNAPAKINFNTPGTGSAILKVQGTERVRIDSSGRVLIGTTTEGQANADEFTISFNNTGVPNGDQGRCGMTIRSGSNTSSVEQNGYIYFSNGTSGDNEYKGTIVYEHGNDALKFGTNGGAERLRIDSGGGVRINNSRTTSTKLHVVGGTGNGTAYDVAVFAGGVNSTSGSGARIWLTGCENDPTARGTVIEGLMTDNQNAHALIFKTSAAAASPSERLRINPTGGLKLSNTSSGNLLDYGGSTEKPNAAINIIRYGTGYADIRLASNYGAGISFAGASDNTDEYRISQDNQKNAYHSLEYNGFIDFATNTNTSFTRACRMTNGHVLFSGLSTKNDTRNAKGITIKSSSAGGGISFQNFGANGSRNWRIRPDDLTGWGALEFSVSPTANSATDWPDSASDVVLSLEPNKNVIVRNGNLGLDGQSSPQAKLHIGNYGTNQNINQSSVTQYFIDSTRSLKIARQSSGNITTNASWYNVAVLPTFNYSYRCQVSLGGDFTADIADIDITTSWNSSLNNGFSIQISGKATSAHATERITKARIVNDSGTTRLQVYIAAGVNSNTTAKVVLETTAGIYAQTAADNAYPVPITAFSGSPTIVAVTHLNYGVYGAWTFTSASNGTRSYSVKSGSDYVSGEGGGNGSQGQVGRFTAPMAGLYQMNFVVDNITSGNSQVLLSFYASMTYNSENILTNTEEIYDVRNSTTQSEQGEGFSTILKMAKGNYFSIDYYRPGTGNHYIDGGGQTFSVSVAKIA